LLGCKASSLIDATITELAHRKVDSVGILASPTTIRTKLFETRLQEAGMTAIVPLKAQQKRAEQLIRKTIAGNTPAAQKLQQVGNIVLEEGAKKEQKL
jgi:aspartate racemase